MMVKNIFIIVIGVFISLVIVFLGIVLGFGATVKEVDKNLKEKEATISVDKNKLEATDIKIQGNKITGIIENTLDYEIDYLEINFKFYDKDKVTISDEMTNKTNFLPGEIWKFSIYLREDGFDSYDYKIEMSVY